MARAATASRKKSTPQSRKGSRRQTAVATVQDPSVMDEKAAARYVGVSAGVLQLWRLSGANDGPDYFRCGPRLIRYRKVDLDEWIEARLSKRGGAR